jgi:hypothetical protein
MPWENFMSIFNKDPAKTLKYILITVWLSSGGLAVATAMVEEPQYKKPAVAPDLEQGELKKGAQLRCWQRGTLLFEENDLEPVGELKGQLGKFNKNSNNSTIYLINDQNGLCVLRSYHKPE